MMSCITPSETIDNTTIVSGAPSFLRNGDLNMSNGDIIDIEMDYDKLGHLAYTGQLTTVRS